MNDEFLTLHRPAVRPQFAAGLYDRLIHPSRVQRANAYLHTRRGLATAAILVLLIAACARVILSSPNYRYSGQLAGFHIVEIDYRVILPSQGEEFLPSVTEANQTESQLPQPGTFVTIQEALEMLSYSLDLPDTLPGGFSLSTDSTIHRSIPARGVLIANWKLDGDASGINLWVTESEMQVVVVPGKWREIEINGAPAIFVQGGFPEPELGVSQEKINAYIEQLLQPHDQINVDWDDTFGRWLYWSADGRQHRLWTFNAEISESDLIAIAESIH